MKEYIYTVKSTSGKYTISLALSALMSFPIFNNNNNNNK